MDRDEARSLVYKNIQKYNKPLVASELKAVLVGHSKSRILQSNEGLVWTFSLQPLEGLFKKTNPVSIAFGMKYCNMVKEQFNCNGIFTSEELPAYGMTLKDKRIIESNYDKNPGDGQVIVVLAYNKSTAENIRSYLLHTFEDLMSQSKGSFVSSPLHYKQG